MQGRDATPPFDRPSETLAEAVAEQLDFAARLDALERKQDAQLLRTGTLDARVAGLQADVSRGLDAGTANGLTPERVEKGITELRVLVKKLLGGARG